LLDFLTVPKRMAWVPEKLEANPGRLHLATEVRKLNWPLLGEFWLERRFAWKRVPSPAEGEGFWEHYLPAFTPPVDAPYVPGPEHVTDEEAERLRNAVREVCACQHRSDFVGQYAGFPRVRLLRKVFPEARFIQVVRNPRSVAYHLVRRIEGGDHKLWGNREAWKAVMPSELRERLEGLEDTPLNFSGVLVRWYHNLYQEELGTLPEEDRAEVAYADLMGHPERTLKRAIKFVGMEYDKRFDYYLKYHSIHQNNRRTKRNLSTEETEQLEKAVDG